MPQAPNLQILELLIVGVVFRQLLELWDLGTKSSWQKKKEAVHSCTPVGMAWVVWQHRWHYWWWETSGEQLLAGGWVTWTTWCVTCQELTSRWRGIMIDMRPPSALNVHTPRWLCSAHWRHFAGRPHTTLLQLLPKWFSLQKLDAAHHQQMTLECQKSTSPTHVCWESCSLDRGHVLHQPVSIWLFHIFTAKDGSIGSVPILRVVWSASWPTCSWSQL